MNGAHRKLAVSLTFLFVYQCVLLAQQIAPHTAVSVVFKVDQKAVAGAIVEVYEQPQGVKPLYSGRTDEKGAHVVPGTSLNSKVEYFFVVRRAGYLRRFEEQLPGKPIRFELVKKYGPQTPED